MNKHECCWHSLGVKLCAQNIILMDEIHVVHDLILAVTQQNQKKQMARKHEKQREDNC